MDLKNAHDIIWDPISSPGHPMEAKELIGDIDWLLARLAKVVPPRRGMSFQAVRKVFQQTCRGILDE